MLAYLGLEIPRDPGRPPPSDEFLRRALDQVERARNEYLERLRVFERRRIRAKEHGNRQLCNAERAALRDLLGGVG